MNERNKQALADFVLALADDELILAHRNSEWCGHAPILEEDIAFANLALDELGHAILWYQLHAVLTGQDPETTPDQLVYFREPFEFRAAVVLRAPKGDWALSMLRQYFWDTLEDVRLAGFVESKYGRLAETAAKIRTEEVYHLRHTFAWVKRLGLGTEESGARMRAALDLLWPYSDQLVRFGVPDEAAEALGIPNADAVWETWFQRVEDGLGAAGLSIPEASMLTLDRSLQSGYLPDILAELQQVARLDPEAEW